MTTESHEAQTQLSSWGSETVQRGWEIKMHFFLNLGAFVRRFIPFKMVPFDGFVYGSKVLANGANQGSAAGGAQCFSNYVVMKQSDNRIFSPLLSLMTKTTTKNMEILHLCPVYDCIYCTFFFMLFQVCHRSCNFWDSSWAWWTWMVQVTISWKCHIRGKHSCSQARDNNWMWYGTCSAAAEFLVKTCQNQPGGRGMFSRENDPTSGNQTRILNWYWELPIYRGPSCQNGSFQYPWSIARTRFWKIRVCHSFWLLQVGLEKHNNQRSRLSSAAESASGLFAATSVWTNLWFVSSYKKSKLQVRTQSLVGGFMCFLSLFVWHDHIYLLDGQYPTTCSLSIFIHNHPAGGRFASFRCQSHCRSMEPPCLLASFSCGGSWLNSSNFYPECDYCTCVHNWTKASDLQEYSFYDVFSILWPKTPAVANQKKLQQLIKPGRSMADRSGCRKLLLLVALAVVLDCLSARVARTPGQLRCFLGRSEEQRRAKEAELEAKRLAAEEKEKEKQRQKEEEELRKRQVAQEEEEEKRKLKELAQIEAEAVRKAKQAARRPLNSFEERRVRRQATKTTWDLWGMGADEWWQKHIEQSILFRQQETSERQKLHHQLIFM